MAAASCAARGHIATPAEMRQLREAPGLSAAGKITLSGPGGRVSARVVLGAQRPDALRIEIPSGAGLRFLLVSRHGQLRADLPGEDAMFEGAATPGVVEELFGIALDPGDLVAAILGDPPATLPTVWRFDSARPVHVTFRGALGRRLVLSLDEPALEAPPARAFDFPAPRGRQYTAREMSERLGLRR